MNTDDEKKREYSQIYGAGITLKERVFLVLNKYPMLKPKEICAILHINFYKFGNTVRSYKYQYRKRESKIRRGLKSLSTKNVRYFGYVLESIDRKNLTIYNRNIKGSGVWFQSKAKNRMLIFKCGIGRIEWFETGRVNCWIKKPATLGKMKQLLTEGFFKTGLIFDINIFNEWTETFRLLGLDLVLETGEVLPYAKISLLKDQTGVVVVMGDKSHPTGLEMHIVLPRWRQHQEQLQKITLETIETTNALINNFNKLLTGPAKNGGENIFTV